MFAIWMNRVIRKILIAGPSSPFSDFFQEKFFNAKKTAAKIPEPKKSPKPTLPPDLTGRATIADAIARHPLLKNAQVQNKVAFLRLVPLIARASGVKPPKADDGSGEPVNWWNCNMLDIAADAAQRLKLPHPGELEGDPTVIDGMKRLMERMSEQGSREWSFAEIYGIVGELGVFPKLAGMTEGQRRSVLGRILKDYAGKKYFRAASGRAVTWQFFGSGNSRRYVLTVED